MKERCAFFLFISALFVSRPRCFSLRPRDGEVCDVVEKSKDRNGDDVTLVFLGTRASDGGPSFPVCVVGLREMRRANHGIDEERGDDESRWVDGWIIRLGMSQEEIEWKSSPCARICSCRFQLYGYGMVQPEGDTRYAAAKQGGRCWVLSLSLSWSSLLVTSRIDG